MDDTKFSTDTDWHRCTRNCEHKLARSEKRDGWKGIAFIRFVYGQGN